ncbi:MULTISPECIES: SSI family serine proteinase inhibitor [Streptomyces]|uniref:Serine protease n=1 Tax=Streptomyces xanthii TaxID=2768069 RepID=A0A7H1B499_9ACTN|nr:SSI family serine proteinase inhibitor [Streptomyces xanthii]QNS03554.1 serine protease [Streptomyces xanthii]
MVKATLTTARRALAAAAAAAALLGTTAAGAQAAPPDAPPTDTGNWVRVTVMQGDGPTGATSSALLDCTAERGDHPHTERACAELAEAAGDVDRLRADEDAMCPMVYKPLTAYAHGMWNGRRVAYARNFASDCVLYASTGSLFRLAD